MPGVIVNRETLDREMGATAVQLRDALEKAQVVNAVLGRLTKPRLVQEFAYTDLEADAILAVFGRLDALARVAKGIDGSPGGAPFAYMLGLSDLTGLK